MSSQTKPTPPATAAAREDTLRAFACAAIVIACYAAYRNSFSGPFVFDDAASIPQNVSIRHLTTAFTPPGGGVTVTGRPLLNVSFAINYAFGGPSVVGYHVTNVVIHGLAGLALFGILRRTYASLHTFDSTCAMRLALAASLIWTLHPLQTESVTYVVQRAESLMGLFYLIALYCFIRLADDTLDVGPNGRRWLWASASVASTFCAVATKEVAVSLPAAILLYDAVLLSGSVLSALRKRWLVYLGLGSSWIPLGWWVITAHGRGGTSGFGTGVPWGEYLMTQFPALLTYVRLALWPASLVFDYGAIDEGTVINALGAAIVVVTMLACSLWLLRTGSRPSRPLRSLGIAGIWFFMILAPTSLIPGARQTMAEHRMYLALVPLAAVSAFAIDAATKVLSSRCAGIWSRMRGSAWPAGTSTWASSLALVTVIVALGLATVRRNRLYSSDLDLWSDTARKVPSNPDAHNGVGVALYELGRLDEAEVEYRRALELRPLFSDAENNLGEVYLEKGNFAEARRHFSSALQMNPDNAWARSNLGCALAKLGLLQAGRNEIEAALRQVPDDSRVRSNLASILVQLGMPEKAEASYRVAIAQDPYNASLHFDLGTLLYRTKRLTEAVVELGEAVSLKPGYADAHNNLAIVQLNLGQIAEALSHLHQAVQIKPENIGFRFNLANALAQTGRRSEALRQYDEILAKTPGFQPAIAMRGRLVNATQ